MKSLRQYFWECILILAISLSWAPVANAYPEFRRAAILSTMTEAALSTLSLLQGRLGGEVQGFSWSANYSSRDFTYSGRGVVGKQEVSFVMSGYVWGTDKQDLLITYSGTGVSGKERISLNGRADLPFDKDKVDYMNMDFSQVVKVGENSEWGWVKGSEIFIGGTLGAGAAIFATGAMTGGSALVGSFFIGGMGAATGGELFLSLSKSILNPLTESNEPIPPPTQPERPSFPGKGKPIELTPGQIITMVFKDGRISGYGPTELMLSGKYDQTKAYASGEIFAIKR